MFGAGGGTSSYREVEDAQVLLLWGSNARQTHPIFFHHVLKARRRGARLVVVDPRRTSTAAWADVHLQVPVGGDITLANGLAHVILEEGLEHRDFLQHATEGLEAYRAVVRRFPPARVAAETGVTEAALREVARAYARAERAMICWTLGITEHAHGVDNVLALIDLGLLTGHVGRPGSGLNPLRGQNNVQGGGDMGALPHKLPGFLDVEDAGARAPFEAAWGRPIPAERGWHLTQMFEAMEAGQLRSLYVVGENPAQSEADAGRTRRLLSGLEHLVVQDLTLTATAELATVVLPATASALEAEGTVTNSERRVQRVRRAVRSPEGPRDDLELLSQLSSRLGYELGLPDARAAWEEVRRLSPLHRGMAWERLERPGGLQWPCPEEDHPGTPFLHGRLWERPLQGPRVAFHPVEPGPPADPLDARFPLRLTTGRRLEAFNTGVQSSALSSPRSRPEGLELSPDDAAALGVREGERVRVVSRRGAVEAPVRVDRGLSRGLAFMTFHFPAEVDTNLLTADATDPRSGTAEFKATAVRVERLR